MALKRASFTLTVAAGVAKTSAHLAIPSSPTRPCYLEALSVDDTAATGQLISLELAEGYNIAGDGVIEPTQVIFSLDDTGAGIPSGSLDGAGLTTAGSLPLIRPRTTAGVVDETGTPVTSAYVRIPIRSPYLVLTGFTGPKRLIPVTDAGDVYTVYVEYETAGDFRF